MLNCIILSSVVSFDRLMAPSFPKHRILGTEKLRAPIPVDTVGCRNFMDNFNVFNF